MAYERHIAMTEPARGGAEIWRTALGATLSAAIYVGGLSVVVGLVQVLSSETGLIDEFALGDTPRGAFLLLFSFVLMALGPILLARPLHRRNWLGYFGPLGLAQLDFLLTCRALIILAAVIWLALPYGFDFTPGLAPRNWLLLLPLTVLAILVQSGAEEMVFRGYLQSQLAARFDSPLVWMLLPSALFALGHYSPADTGTNAIWFAALAFAFGLAAADLTARTGNLGAALGFHFINNMLALALTALPGPLSGLALYLYPMAADDVMAMRPLLAVDLAMIGLSWLATRLALRV